MWSVYAIDACESILKKFEEEQHVEDMQKEWFKQNRDELRQKFVQRHEQNI